MRARLPKIKLPPHGCDYSASQFYLLREKQIRATPDNKTTSLARERARGDATVAYSLLLGNRTEEDILCREQLEDAMRAGAVDLYYTLDKPPEGWSYFSGFVDAPMLETTMPAPGPDTVCFLCGPPPMVNSALAKLEALGHAPENLFCF